MCVVCILNGPILTGFEKKPRPASKKRLYAFHFLRQYPSISSRDITSFRKRRKKKEKRLNRSIGLTSLPNAKNSHKQEFKWAEGTAPNWMANNRATFRQFRLIFFPGLDSVSFPLFHDAQRWLVIFFLPLWWTKPLHLLINVPQFTLGYYRYCHSFQYRLGRFHGNKHEHLVAPQYQGSTAPRRVSFAINPLASNHLLCIFHLDDECRSR